MLRYSTWLIRCVVERGTIVSQTDTEDSVIINMNMETLEFIIYPDGRVQEMVTGIVGVSCQEVTAAIEAQLGTVTFVEKTSQYYQQNLTQSVQASNQESFSDW